MVCIVEKKDSTGAWRQIGRPMYTNFQSATDHMRLLGEREVRYMSMSRRLVLIKAKG